MSDEITLRLPRERQFFGVARLVVGGLAARVDLRFEQLDDLQVALAELLERRLSEDEITLTVRVDGDEIRASLGPFDDALGAELAHGDGNGVGLRRVLEAVVDTVEVTDRGGCPWVELTKARA